MYNSITNTQKRIRIGPRNYFGSTKKHMLQRSEERLSAESKAINWCVLFMYLYGQYRIGQKIFLQAVHENCILCILRYTQFFFI